VAKLYEGDHLLALDLEGDLSSSTPDVCLLQIATPSGQCFLFDLLCPDGAHQLFTVGGLGRLLEDVRVMKIGHDLRADSAALYKQFHVFLINTFDTQGANLINVNSNRWIRKRPLSPEMILYAAKDVLIEAFFEMEKPLRDVSLLDKVLAQSCLCQDKARSGQLLATPSLQSYPVITEENLCQICSIITDF